MVSPSLSRGALSLALALAVFDAHAASRNPQELLARSDVASFGPASFRARLLLKPPPPHEGREIEVWRSGEAKTLVRFLSPKERGKYLLRLGGQLWLVAPGAREPVRISASYRLYGGATLDEVLGTRLAGEYAVESASAWKPFVEVVITMPPGRPAATRRRANSWQRK